MTRAFQRYIIVLHLTTFNFGLMGRPRFGGKWPIFGTKLIFFVKIHFASSFKYTSRHELTFGLVCKSLVLFCTEASAKKPHYYDKDALPYSFKPKLRPSRNQRYQVYKPRPRDGDRGAHSNTRAFQGHGTNYHQTL